MSSSALNSPTLQASGHLPDAVKKILTSYYECQGLDYPCEVNCLTISSNSSGSDSVSDARSRSTPSFNPVSDLKLEFHEMEKALVLKIVPLFLPKHVSEFTAVGLNFFVDSSRGILWEMGDLLHL